jgi:hypothetical protein
VCAQRRSAAVAGFLPPHLQSFRRGIPAAHGWASAWCKSKDFAFKAPLGTHSTGLHLHPWLATVGPDTTSFPIVVLWRPLRCVRAFVLTARPDVACRRLDAVLPSLAAAASCTRQHPSLRNNHPLARPHHSAPPILSELHRVSAMCSRVGSQGGPAVAGRLRALVLHPSRSSGRPPYLLVSRV